MNRLITLSFQKGNKFPFTIKIKSQSRFILGIVKNLKIKSENPWFSSLQIHTNRLKTQVDFTTILTGSRDKSYKFNEENAQAYYHGALNFFSFNSNSFILYTKIGSLIKTNLKRRTAVGKIRQNDPFVHTLLDRWATECFLLHYRIKLHAGCIIDKNGLSIIFIGKNGAGKSTICNLLSRNKNSLILDDDSIIFFPIHPRYEKPCLIRYNYNRENLDKNLFSVTYPRQIFFIQKEPAEETKIIPITRKEAFKKIVFASEFPQNENKVMKKNRIAALCKLVEQCGCFLLINGKELKQNPDEFSGLILSAINKS